VSLPPLHREELPTPLGPVIAVADDGRLVGLEFADVEARLARWLRRHRPGRTVRAAPCGGGIAERLTAYFAGALEALCGIAVDPGGTPFQREVWTALRAVPAGTTLSYGTFAATIGRARASRAVGHANGANPVAIVIPCHRLIGGNGSLTGYAGGLDRKRWLLQHEGVTVAGGSSSQ
jgi:methylated-DNA-[protein]-cysteine S-methyltransferase